MVEGGPRRAPARLTPSLRASPQEQQEVPRCPSPDSHPHKASCRPARTCADCAGTPDWEGVPRQWTRSPQADWPSPLLLYQQSRREAKGRWKPLLWSLH